jgi:hypothetical protein
MMASRAAALVCLAAACSSAPIKVADGGAPPDALLDAPTSDPGPQRTFTPDLAQDPVPDSGADLVSDVAGAFQALGETCDIMNDTCRPGTICLQESLDHAACGAHCYGYCRTDGDCGGGAKCIIDVQFGSSSTLEHVCTAPVDGCDPWGVARCQNAPQRPYPTFGCYLMSVNQTNQTICDCAGTVPLGMPCRFEHECVPGAECVLYGGATLCRQICSTQAGAPGPALCPMGQTCTPFPGSTKYGYCH